MSKIKEYHLEREEEETREERRKALFGRMFGNPTSSKAYYQLKRTTYCNGELHKTFGVEEYVVEIEEVSK